MRVIERFAGGLAAASAWIAGAIMLLMMIQISLDVLLKHFLNWPIPMTLETVAAYYMVALVFLPLGQVTRREEHLEVELFTQNLRPRALAAVKLFGCVIGIVYVAILLSEGVAEAVKMTGRGEVWETATVDLEVWPARWFLPVGGALMLLWLVLQGLNHLVFALAGRALIADQHDG
jgi:TRAP-type C4-dicarboxylate transport system permease small subunit